jgi:hypothetical protein
MVWFPDMFVEGITDTDDMAPISMPPSICLNELAGYCLWTTRGNGVNIC